MSEPTEPKKQPRQGAKVESSAWKGGQSYVATMEVDGQDLTVIANDSDAGIKGDKGAALFAGKPKTAEINDKYPLHYSADTNSKFNSISTPHTGAAMASKNLIVQGFDYLKKGVEAQHERDIANQAPEVIKLVREAMFGKDSPGVVTPEEFRKIRDTFQQIEATAEHTANTPPPKHAPGKDSPKR